MTAWRVEVESFAGAVRAIAAGMLGDAAAAAEVVVAAVGVLENGAARLALEVEAESAGEAAKLGEAFLAQVLH